jgi:hypothetical protein
MHRRIRPGELIHDEGNDEGGCPTPIQHISGQVVPAGDGAVVASEEHLQIGVRDKRQRQERQVWNDGGSENNQDGYRDLPASQTGSGRTGGAGRLSKGDHRAVQVERLQDRCSFM